MDLGANVLYVDAAYYLNLMANQPAVYALTDSTTPVCTSVDTGVGIGVGTGDINSLLCNATTVVPGAIYTAYMFADKLNLAPSAHRLFGDYASGRTRTRW